MTCNKPACAISFVNHILSGYEILFADGSIKGNKLPGGWVVTISTKESTKTPFVSEDFIEKFLVNVYPAL